MFFFTQSLCNCGITNRVDYTDNIIRDVLIAGIYDIEIRRDILGIDGIIDKSVNDVVSLVEKREMARNANTVSGNMSAISSFRQENKKNQDNRRLIPPSPGLIKPCPAKDPMPPMW